MLRIVLQYYFFHIFLMNNNDQILKRSLRRKILKPFARGERICHHIHARVVLKVRVSLGHYFFILPTYTSTYTYNLQKME
jgi:hypothetical protein